MKFLVLFFVALLTISSLWADVSYENLIKEQWDNFKLKYGKLYDNESEEQYRLNIFMDNLHFINKHNILYTRGLSTYKVGINQFADLLHSEYLERFTMNMTSSSDFEDYQSELEDIPLVNHTSIGDEELADQMNWRTRGAVTGVKSQGMCGSCWTFSTTGALEGQWFLKRRKLVSLSEQNLLDCSAGSYGCRGGFPHKAFEYIIRNRGIDTERSYPYQGRQMPCRFRRNSIGATERSYRRTAYGNENALKAAVASIGPVSVAIDASDPGFQQYSGGLYSNRRCSTTRLTHAVLAVGYGRESRGDYWLVKNSWGTYWGEQGYFKLIRNRGNQCGIASQGIYPIV